MKIRFHPEASAEAEQSADWYEAREEGLGEEFLEELDEALSMIQELPLTWPYWPRLGKQHGVRRCSLKRFPFGVGYLIEGDMVVVVAVAHERRRPGFWLDRLPP